MSTIVTRAGKGSPLTNAEVDANFTNLNSDKYESGDSPAFGSITVTGTVNGRDIATDGTKLDTVETNADVTDTANVTAAGAAMTANNLSDLANAATAIANLGITSTASELNILDGATLTTTELNYVDGVTSAIQTQLDAKVAKTSSTGSAALPAGTTAQRDGTPAAGYLRFNSSLGEFEGHDGTDWGSIGGGGVELTQTQAEDDTSTVFGQVSGQRLYQAVVEHRRLDLITTATASGDATIDFTLDNSVYDVFLLKFNGVKPATNYSDMWLRTSGNGGTSFDDGSNNYAIGAYETRWETSNTAFRIYETHILLGGYSGGVNNNVGFTGTAEILAAGLSEDTIFMINGYYRKPNNQPRAVIAGVANRQSASAVDAVRIMFSSGNISSGTVALYGFRKGH